MLRGPSSRVTSGARRWASRRSGGTRRTLPADHNGGDERRGRCCERGPITTPSSSAPATTASSPPPTSPAPDCARCCSRRGRRSVERPPARRSPGRRSTSATATTSTFRTTPVAAELDLASHGLRYIDMEPAQVGTAWSGGPAWRHWHDVGRTMDELAATHPGELDGYRRYLRAARPAVAHDPRRGERTAVDRPAHPAGDPPPPGRRADGAALGPSQRGRRDARLLHPRRRGGPRSRQRSDGVGHQPRTAGVRPGRADLRDASRRTRRTADRRQRGADRRPASGVRAPRRHVAHRQRGRRGAVRRRAGDGASR